MYPSRLSPAGPVAVSAIAAAAAATDQPGLQVDL